MNRTDRLMATLLELQARGELRAEDLARRFEVSVRTVYRDLDALAEGGVPIAAAPGRGYWLMDGYFLPPLSFTADEAATLALGGAFVRGRVDPELRRAADEALRKLDAVLPSDRRAAVDRWRREIRFPTEDRATVPDGTLLADLRTVIRARAVLRILYHAPRRPDPEPREVEPVSLAYVLGAWHLTAYCRLRRAPRIFRLDRIDRWDRQPERFELGERHRIEAHEDRLEGFPEARVRVDPAVERWVRERQPFPFLREEAADGGPVFVYALRDERELVPWLLGWGAAVEVLEPEGLRERLAAEARAILARYAPIAAPSLSDRRLA